MVTESPVGALSSGNAIIVGANGGTGSASNLGGEGLAAVMFEDEREYGMPGRYHDTAATFTPLLGLESLDRDCLLTRIDVN